MSISKDPWGPPSGWAVRRNGSCLPDECSTNASHGIFRCCPSGSICTNAYTGACCPDKGDCRDTIKNPAHCANETWDLYKNKDGGLFCCEQGESGFRMSSGVGCAVPGDPTIGGTAWLPILSPGKIQLLHTRDKLKADMSRREYNIQQLLNTEHLPNIEHSIEHSIGQLLAINRLRDIEQLPDVDSHTGAIAGGVVGGVAGLAIIFALFWFFMRRRSKKQLQQNPAPVTEASMAQYHSVPPSDIRSELGSPSTRPSELEGQASVSELPGHKDETPTVHELPENPRT
ncbi:uncharacterized protein N7500_007292 [Penicillium coprophilum]|uniref:uncharacterized protein n=1 Tax=Penicillium coprophilum TaxID=36646 RepID=UPI002382822C|nr:uncharacterized protein N7500_007292 [Penicillium coprophilum]KAJ5165462.1 hypothetical protein N7500_007292 [Penicillium coprophilum]